MEESKLFIGGLAAEATEDDVRALFSPHGFITEIAMLPTKSTTGQKCCFVKYGTKPAAESANEALQTLNGKFQMPGTDRPIAVRWADNGKGENPGKGERTSGPPSAPPMGMHAPMYGGYPLQQPVMHMMPGMPQPGMPGMPQEASPYGMPQMMPGMPGMPGMPEAMNPYMLPGVPHSSGMPAGGMPLAMPGGASMEEAQGTKLFVGGLPGHFSAAQLQPLFDPYGMVIDTHMMKPSDKTGQRCAFIKYSMPASAQAAVAALNGRMSVSPTDGPIVVRYADGGSREKRQRT